MKQHQLNNLCPSCNLLSQYNAKLLEQLKSGLKRTINWKKYQPKVSTSFQGVNRIFKMKHKEQVTKNIIFRLGK